MCAAKGKLITIFNPGNHGDGSTTISTSLGIGLQYMSNKKVLLVNRSGSMSYMERYMENEVDAIYTYDTLKIFNNNISVKQLMTFATQINENFYLVAGSSLPKAINKAEDLFEDNFINECLTAFDAVIADVPSGVKEENKSYLERADLVLAIMRPNEIMLDDIFKKPGKDKLRQYIKMEKTLPVFNMLYSEWNIEKELMKLNKKYDLDYSFGIVSDGTLYEACNKKRQLYTYIRSEMTQQNNLFPQQIRELCEVVASRLDINLVEKLNVSKSIFERFFSRG